MPIQAAAPLWSVALSVFFPPIFVMTVVPSTETIRFTDHVDYFETQIDRLESQLLDLVKQQRSEDDAIRVEMRKHGIRKVMDSALVRVLDDTARDEPKATVVVLFATSTTGISVAQSISENFGEAVSHNYYNVTARTARFNSQGTASSASMADIRTGLTDTVAEVLDKDPSSIITFDTSVFAEISGALTAFHTCWDSQGKISTPKFDVSCAQATFVVLIHVLDNLSIPNAKTPNAQKCDDYKCAKYDDSLKLARDWLKKNVLPSDPSDRQAAEVEDNAILRRITDMILLL